MSYEDHEPIAETMDNRQAELDAMADADGFPAELEDGTIVLITRKEPQPQGPTLLYDAEGTAYVANANFGRLTIVEAA
jgi:hypothetical protein